jgi:hypothetical protein
MRRVTLLATGAAIAALVLSGCGANQQQAPDQGSSDFGSFRLMAESVGQKSATKQSAHMRMNVDTAGQSIKAEGDLRLGADFAMDVTMSLAGLGEAQLVLVDDVAYIKLPAEVEPGKQWIKIDTNGTDPISKTLGGVLKQAKDNGDPAQLLKQLMDSGEITATKKEDLGGISTTHYSVTVDIKKAAAQANPDLKPVLEKAIENGLTTYPFEIWLDNENLPVKITSDTPFVNPQTQQADKVKLTVEYSDWGKAVSVTAPPADQVTTAR